MIGVQISCKTISLNMKGVDNKILRNKNSITKMIFHTFVERVCVVLTFFS